MKYVSGFFEPFPAHLASRCAKSKVLINLPSKRVSQKFSFDIKKTNSIVDADSKYVEKFAKSFTRKSYTMDDFLPTVIKDEKPHNSYLFMLIPIFVETFLQLISTNSELASNFAIFDTHRGWHLLSEQKRG